MLPLKKSFRYNGSDLQLIKTKTKQSNPQLAVEAFIDEALKKAFDPQDYLEWLKEERDEKAIKSSIDSK